MTTLLTKADGSLRSALDRDQERAHASPTLANTPKIDLCIHVCMGVYTYIYIHTYLHIYIYVRMHTHMYMCKNIYTHTYK